MPPRFTPQTLAQLRRSVGSLMFRGRFLFDTVRASPAPTSTTFALTKAMRQPDDTYVGRVAYAVAGTSKGSESLVTDSVSGTGVFTVAPSVSPVFDATTVVEIWPEGLSPEQVTDALNLAIADAEELVNVRLDVTNPVIDSTYKIVTIPANFVKLIDISYAGSGGEWVPYYVARYANVLTDMQRGYVVRSGGAALSEPIPSSTLGTNIVVRGYRLPNRLVNDTDLCEVHPAFLVYQAAYLLEAGESYGPSVDPEQHSGRAANWLRSALTIREQMGTNWEPGTQELEV